MDIATMVDSVFTPSDSKNGIRLCALFGLLWPIAGCATEADRSNAAADIPKTVAEKNVTVESSGKKPGVSSVQGKASRNAEEHCQAICRISAELKCRVSYENCEIACEEMRNIQVCREQMQAVMRCIVKEPVSHWECNDADIAAIQEAFCQNEQRAFMDCFAENGN